MKDWTAIARVTGLELPDPGSLAPLDGLEKAFRPLVAQLGATDDIAVDYAAVLHDEDAR